MRQGDVSGVEPQRLPLTQINRYRLRFGDRLAGKWAEVIAPGSAVPGAREGGEVPTVSDDRSFIAFTDEEAEAYRRAAPPEAAQLNRLTAEYARKQGGDVLAVTECLEGPLMGKNLKWRADRIADHLGLSQRRVEQIHDEMMAAVWPVFQASGDYPAFEAWAEVHCGHSRREAEAR